MPRLTDKTRKKIIADYVGCENYSEVARKYGVARNTVKAIVAKDGEAAEKCRRKKEQNTADVLSHMEQQKDTVCGLLDKFLAAMADDDKIQRAGVQQLATALGIIVDKYTATAQNEQALQKLDALMDKVGGVI